VQGRNGYWMTMTVIDLFVKDVSIDLPSFDLDQRPIAVIWVVQRDRSAIVRRALATDSEVADHIATGSAIMSEYLTGRSLLKRLGEGS
jgi:hypothetical protein